MRVSIFAVIHFISTVLAINVILSNDDGWAELNIRQFFDALTAAPYKYSVVLSAPAENKSGTGSTDVPPTVLNITCEFDTCPVGSPPEGFNASMPRLNYVNSFPVDAMRFGIQTLAPKFFGREPIDIAVAGFNVGTNLGPVALISGTVGATTEAAKEGVPGIAFSGSSSVQQSFTTPIEPNNGFAVVYAQLSAKLTDALVQGNLVDRILRLFGFKQTLLAPNTWLNVNYPPSNNTFCPKASDFKFILTRINSHGPVTSSTPKDVFTCGSDRLPDETTVNARTDGCFATVSVGNDQTKDDVSAELQAVALGRLSGVLSCLPKSK